MEAFFVGGVTSPRTTRTSGLRPTPHLDVLVDADRAAAARARLPRVRWTLRPDQDADAPGPWVYTDPDGQSVSSERRSGSTSSSAARRAARTRLSSKRRSGTTHAVRACSCRRSTDALLTTCVMGARRGPIPNIQWIADAVMILRSAGDRVDWERFVRLGSERGQTLRLRQALPYVSLVPGSGPYLAA